MAEATTRPDDPVTVLAGEFPTPTEEQWLEQVGKALGRGGSPLTPAEALAKLRSTTADGITIDPLYTAADETGPRPLGRVGGWEIRQPVLPPLTAARVLEELEKGAGGVILDLSSAELDVRVIDSVLDGVLLDVASVSFRPGARWREALDALATVWKRRGVDPSTATGSIGADPLGEHLASGGLADLDAHLAALGPAAHRLDGSGVRLVTIDGSRMHLAGATDATELGAAIAAFVATLRALVDGGVDPAGAFASIEIELAATADQFATIAKFRAVRRLIGRVAGVVAVPDAADTVHVHAASSAAMLSAYDPWVNLLRGTVACFAAGVAGADSIALAPYDSRLERADDELGRRLARNTQSILALESHLGAVADPAGGSWYVEQLTADLAEAAWAWFQEIEAASGFRAAADSGLLTERFAAGWEARTARLDTRRDPLTGVSEFPNIAETPPVLLDAPASTGGLPVHHLAERFESLRQRVDAVAAAGTRPAVFLAAIGTPAQTTARITFTKNLFEVGGIRTVEGPASTDPAEIAAAMVASATTVACVCSSDAVYDEHAAAVIAALRDAAARRVYLAGKPRPALTEAGVVLDGHIAAGGDVYATLADLLAFWEVP